MLKHLNFYGQRMSCLQIQQSIICKKKRNKLLGILVSGKQPDLAAVGAGVWEGAKMMTWAGVGVSLSLFTWHFLFSPGTRRAPTMDWWPGSRAATSSPCWTGSGSSSAVATANGVHIPAGEPGSAPTAPRLEGSMGGAGIPASALDKPVSSKLGTQLLAHGWGE